MKLKKTGTIILVGALTALLLAFGTITAFAVPSGWTVDRKASAVFESVAPENAPDGRSDVIKQSIAGEDFNDERDETRATRGIYDNHQGYKKDVAINGDVWTATTYFYVDPAVKNSEQPMNSSIWLTVDDGHYDNYLVVAFLNQDPNSFYSDTSSNFKTGWYYWNDLALKYEKIPGSDIYSTAGWHKIEVAAAQKGIVDYYIDGEKLYSRNYNNDDYGYATEFGSAVLPQFKLATLTLNSYNFGGDYTVFWAMPLAVEGAPYTTSATVPPTTAKINSPKTGVDIWRVLLGIITIAAAIAMAAYWIYRAANKSKYNRYD
ncbi:MAG: hypothetical protein LBM65_05810 [Oscillospiraceae bacterium]|jgi:hypothetical protein|nr:hypothetical protein [Oscillospiraceae bacterium]